MNWFEERHHQRAVLLGFAALRDPFRRRLKMPPTSFAGSAIES